MKKAISFVLVGLGVLVMATSIFHLNPLPPTPSPGELLVLAGGAQCATGTALVGDICSGKTADIDCDGTADTGTLSPSSDIICSGNSICGVNGSATCGGALLHTGQTASQRTGDDAFNDGTSKGYTDNGDGTVTDNHAGLMWQKDDQVSKVWDDAIDYCYDLKLCNDNSWTTSTCSGGAKYDDWRLPTAIEGVMMLDYSCDTNFPAHCFDRFKNNALTWDDCETINCRLWLSTSRVDHPVYAYFMYMDDGAMYLSDKTATNYVRCVRGQ